MHLFSHIFPLMAAIVATLLTGPPVASQGLADLQPSYTRIASGCGDDPASPSYSDADYAQALADAAKALRSATKEGGRSRMNAIQKSLTRLKECMAEETHKFVLPSINNCADFLIEFNAFSMRTDLLMRTAKITAEERQSAREMFRKPAMDCVRHIMSKCIDPTDTRTVDFVIEVMRAAATLEFILDYGSETGLRRFWITNNASIPKMSFCTDTDYACHGDPQACSNRITQIKAIMQSYLDE